jgi:hypothetical protein
MPNWCANTVRIRSYDNQSALYIAELTRYIKENEQMFEFIKPCPSELTGTVAGFMGDTDQQNALEVLQANNTLKYGYANWYDFQVAEWGTKWDARNIEIIQEDIGLLIVSFDTAWSPPVGIYDQLISKDINVIGTFCEQGCGYLGYYINGIKIVEDFICEDDEEGNVNDNFTEFFESHGLLELTPQHYGG